MTRYAWNAFPAGQFVDWNTASDWLPLGVPNAAAEVSIPLIARGGNADDFFVIIGAAASCIIHWLTRTKQTLILDGMLSVAAGLTLAAAGLHNDGTLLLEAAADIIADATYISLAESAANGRRACCGQRQAPRVGGAIVRGRPETRALILRSCQNPRACCKRTTP